MVSMFDRVTRNSICQILFRGCGVTAGVEPSGAGSELHPSQSRG